MSVISIIQSILNGPENHSIFVSFQNILNHHYNKVFDIIFSFSDLTLKQIKKFKIFTKREMPQDLSKIHFSEKYKRAVFLFYELLSKNPKSGDEFIKLLDTLPHNKESAIFILKLKLQLKREMKGGLVNEVKDAKAATSYLDDAKKYDSIKAVENSLEFGSATDNLLRVFHALYVIRSETLALVLSGLLKKNFDVEIPLSTKVKNEVVSDFYNVKEQIGGSVEEEYQKVSKVIADNIIQYIDTLLNSEGFKKMKEMISPEKMGDYLNTIGTAASVQTLLPMEYIKVISGVMHAVTAQTAQYNAKNEAASKTNNEEMRNKFHNMKETLEAIQKELVQSLKDLVEYREKIVATINQLKVPQLKKILGYEDSVPNAEPNAVPNAEPVNKDLYQDGIQDGVQVGVQVGGKPQDVEIPENVKNIISSINTNENVPTPKGKIDQTIFYIVLLYKNSIEIITNIDNMDSDFDKKKIEITSGYKEFEKLASKLKELMRS